MREPARPEAKHSLTIWQVVKLIEVRLRFIVILAVTGATIVYWDTIANYWSKWTRPPKPATADSDSEYYCPMHPSVVRSELEPDGSMPKCPICGMSLSKRKKGQQAELPEGVLSRAQFSPEQIRLAGIATVEVGYRRLVKELRTIGYVNYDESRLSKVTSRVDGYVERLYVNKTFETVEEGDKLAEVYSPGLYSTVRNLLTSLRGGAPELVESGRERLRLLGVDDREIDEIIETRKAGSRLVLRAPQRGHVIRKEVVQGSRVHEGMTLFEVADLSMVWIEADVFEKDAAFLREGQAIEAHVESFPGKRFNGRVSLVHPHLQSDTRTNRVRFELGNPDHELRPGMYANVKLSVPIDEIEPFRTQAAQRKQGADTEQTPSDDDAWLIASQRTCPVTGAVLGSMGEPVKVPLDAPPDDGTDAPPAARINARSIFLCCEGCRDKFEADPEGYLARLAPPPEGAVLAVPERAVIDSGSRKVVYIEREPGLFQGVEVQLGPRTGEFYPVAKGLLPGDRVAAAGSFLVDADTRLNPAAAAAYLGAGGQAPVAPGSNHSHRHGSHDSEKESSDEESSEPPSTPSSGPLASKKPTRAAQRQATRGKTAKKKDSDPKIQAALAKLSDDDRELALAQRTCPVIEGSRLGGMGTPVKLIIDGQPVFVCCAGCKQEALADPDGTLAKAKELKEETDNE